MHLRDDNDVVHECGSSKSNRSRRGRLLTLSSAEYFEEYVFLRIRANTEELVPDLKKRLNMLGNQLDDVVIRVDQSL